jgi:peptidoglycan/xylan/chitin deacetylase (PgdA/CDA1 family)
MTDDALATMALDASRLPARLHWAHGLIASLPAALLDLLTEPSGAVDNARTRAIAAAAAHDLRLRSAFTPIAPATSRTPISYRAVPGPARRLAANILGRIQRLRQRQWGAFPGWPLDLSADIAADLAGEPGITFERTPVLLTHDIDSKEGLENLVRLFIPLEESVDARSANFLVPCAWMLDHGLIRETNSRGHEIGVHGYDHSNRTAFADDAERRRRLAAGRALGDLYEAVGYRAPSLLRTPALLADLAPLYKYDSSIPTSGGPFPVPNNGCATARPWRIDGLYEIPVTLPRDGSLRFLGHGASEIERLWRNCSTVIAASGGLVCLLVHCERGFSGNAAMLKAYRRLLEWFAADSRFEFIRPADLVTRLATRSHADAV